MPIPVATRSDPLPTILTHRLIWDAVDSAAKRHGHSASALARLAGLDPTAFNKSKRVSKDGRERWPSTESIAKILEATGESFERFIAGAEGSQPWPTAPSSSVPLLGFAQAGPGGFFESGGFPSGQGWDDVRLPPIRSDTDYALQVSGDSMLPLYRDGDVIVVSPTAQLRRGDRVVVKTKTGEVMAKTLHRQTEAAVELHSINPDHPPREIENKNIEWIARITWATQ